MNKILKELGISEKVYGEMQELCPNINELSDNGRKCTNWRTK